MMDKKEAEKRAKEISELTLKALEGYAKIDMEVKDGVAKVHNCGNSISLLFLVTLLLSDLIDKMLTDDDCPVDFKVDKDKTFFHVFSIYIKTFR